MELDTISNGQAHGSVAQKLLACGMKVNALRTNATLRKDEWKVYDTAVVKAAQSRLVGVADLMRLGLTYSLVNGLGKTVLEFEDASDFSAAEMSMDGVARSKKDRVEYSIKYLPLPILHKDFSINARVLAASRTTGESLDTTNAELAARKVSELAENILFNGASSYSFGGGTIYGYTDFPSRSTGSLSAHWDHAATGEQIVADVMAMKAKSIAKKHYGPWILYIPSAYESKMDTDFKAASDKTVRQRVLELAGVQAVTTADFLTAGQVVLAEMQSETVRLVEGMPITTVEWMTEGNMVSNFKVMAIWVPQLRADQNGNCGIVHYSEV